MPNFQDAIAVGIFPTVSGQKKKYKMPAERMMHRSSAQEKRGIFQSQEYKPELSEENNQKDP
jgi:hypothetical protein